MFYTSIKIRRVILSSKAQLLIRDTYLTGVQTCDLLISSRRRHTRWEEHTSELQSFTDLVCRLLLEKKNTKFSQVFHRQLLDDIVARPAVAVLESHSHRDRHVSAQQHVRLVSLYVRLVTH